MQSTVAGAIPLDAPRQKTRRRISIRTIEGLRQPPQQSHKHTLILMLLVYNFLQYKWLSQYRPNAIWI